MLKFTYTKPTGEVSERVGLIVSSASKLDLMLDLSDCPVEEQFQIEQSWLEYKAAREELEAKYSFKKYMKTFKPEGISNREVV